MYSYIELENKSFEDLYVKYCGMQECTPHYSYGPALRDHYLIHYCLSGKGMYRVGNKVYHIQKGDAFLIQPHVVTYYQADEVEPWTYMWIGFDGKKVELYLSRCGLDDHHLVAHNDNVDDIRELVISMMAHYKLSYSNELFIQGKFYEFLSYLAKSANVEYKENAHHYQNTYLNKAIEYIQNNYQDMVTVQGIADYLSLNRSYLTTLFKQQLSMSPQEFLLKYRMDKAIDMLINTDLTIHQIAFSVGYGNQLSFSKAFHKTQQMSPRDFRNKYKLIDDKLRYSDPLEYKK